MTDRERVAEKLEKCERCECDNCTEGGTSHIPWDCPAYDNLIENAITLLKEQEIGHWISLENCSNSGVYCSKCHTKVFDSYPFKKKFSYFCPHCGTRMEGETERL